MAVDKGGGKTLIHQRWINYSFFFFEDPPFVDDVTEAAKALDPGVRFDETKMKMVRIEELVETDKNVPEVQRTME